MNKRIYGIILALVLLFIPQTVFADFASCVLVYDDSEIYIEIFEDQEMTVRIYDNNSNNKTVSYNLTTGEVAAIIDYLKSEIEHDELSEDFNLINSFFEESMYNGYLYMYSTSQETALAYSLDRPLITEDELDKSVITKIIEAKMIGEDYITEEDINQPIEEDTITSSTEDVDVFLNEIEEYLPELGMTMITMLLTSCLIPIIMFIMFIKILKALSKKTLDKKNYTSSSNNKTYKNMDEQFFDDLVDEYNRSSQNKTFKNKSTNNQTSRRKRDPWSTDKNDDDPFSV